MDKSKMIMKQNPLTGDWLCSIPNTDQAYYAHSKTNAKKFCATVNDNLDKGLVLVRDGHLVAKRYLVAVDPDGGWVIQPDVNYRTPNRIIYTCDSLAEAKDYLDWLIASPSASSL